MPIRKTNPFTKIFQYFSSFFYCNWSGMKFFMECLTKTIYFVYNAIISLVKKSKGLVSGFVTNMQVFYGVIPLREKRYHSSAYLANSYRNCPVPCIFILILSLVTWLKVGTCYCESQDFSLFRSYGTYYRRNCHRKSYLWTIFGSPYP